MAKIKIKTKTKKIKKNLNLRRKQKKEKMKNKGSENKLLVKKRIHGVKEKSNTSQDKTVSKNELYKEKLSNIVFSYDADNLTKCRKNKNKPCSDGEKPGKLFYEFYGKEKYNSYCKNKSVSYVLKNLSDEDFKRLIGGYVFHHYHSTGRDANNGYNVCVAIFVELWKLLGSQSKNKQINLIASLLLYDDKTDFLERILKIYTTPEQIVEFIKNLDQFCIDEFLYLENIKIGNARVINKL